MQRWGNPPHEAYTASVRSRAIEPRKQQLVEAEAVNQAAGSTRGAEQAWRPGSPEVEEHGDCTRGVRPGTWETPSTSSAIEPAGPEPAQNKAQARGRRARGHPRERNDTQPHG